MKEKSEAIKQGIKKWKGIISAVIIIFILRFFVSNPAWVEQYYTNGIYTFISGAQRIITGWLPFSAGDIGYILTGLVIIFYIIKLFRRNGFTVKTFGILLRKTIQFFLWVYILFNLFWGLNYYRTGFQTQLKIHPDEYSTDDLKKFTSRLIAEINTSRKLISADERNDSSYQAIFSKSISAYNKTSAKYPFLSYIHKSIKPSIYNSMGNYLGFLGYYNPFSGEAQVNTLIPSFLLPFTTCHEIGHQLGYASESEASFAGWLACMHSDNNNFKYSADFELFLIANNELFFSDSLLAKQNFKALDTLVKQDVRRYRNYLIANKNALEPFATDLYSSYLKANNQPEGIESYDEVLAWVIAYKKKYTGM